jgi:hypothetical protein
MTTRNVKIKITVNGNTLSYDDDKHMDGRNEPIDKGDMDDEIQWMSPDGDIAIVFTDTSLFQNPSATPLTLTAQRGQWTQSGLKLVNNPTKSDYKYTAAVCVSGSPVVEDPKIIFDVILDGRDKSGFPSPDAIATAAETAWEKIVEKLTSLKAAEEASGIQFYPHGVTNIQVSVEVEPVTVTVQVSGPES